MLFILKYMWFLFLVKIGHLFITWKIEEKNCLKNWLIGWPIDVLIFEIKFVMFCVLLHTLLELIAFVVCNIHSRNFKKGGLPILVITFNIHMLFSNIIWCLNQIFFVNLYPLVLEWNICKLSVLKICLISIPFPGFIICSPKV